MTIQWTNEPIVPDIDDNDDDAELRSIVEAFTGLGAELRAAAIELRGPVSAPDSPLFRAGGWALRLAGLAIRGLDDDPEGDEGAAHVDRR